MWQESKAGNRSDVRRRQQGLNAVRASRTLGRIEGPLQQEEKCGAVRGEPTVRAVLAIWQLAAEQGPRFTRDAWQDPAPAATREEAAAPSSDPLICVRTNL